jgi:hypothetical protein
MFWGRRSGRFPQHILEPVKVGGQNCGAMIGVFLPVVAVGLVLGFGATVANAQQAPITKILQDVADLPRVDPPRIEVPRIDPPRIEVPPIVLPLPEVCTTRAQECPQPGIRLILPNVPPAIGELVGKGGEDVLGLVYREIAALSQVANNTVSVALGVTQDIVSGVLDPALAPESTAVLGPFGASSPGSASSMFMVSGYKHLSHDGYSVSSDFAPGTGKGPEFEEDNYGLTIGTRFDGSDIFGAQKGSVTFGVLGNYTHTDIEVGAAPNVPGNFKSGSTSIDSWSVGGYGMVTDGFRYGLVTVTGTFGSPETDNALLSAKADYGTFGFAASAMSGVLLPVGSAKLDLRGGLNYLRASSDDYTDSIGSHYTDAHMEEFSGSISARLFGSMRIDQYNIRPFLQGGLNQRFHYENEITVDNAKFSFDDADTSIFGRAGIDFDVDRAIQAYLAVRGDASEDMRAIAAQVGVTFKLD